MPVGKFKTLTLNAEDSALFTFIRNITGSYPGTIAIYRQAFRHSSVAQDIGHGARNSNERLEYLGDAVLSAIVANYLFKKYPYKDEGFLTEMRSKIVSRQHLNIMAQKMGLEKYIDAGKEVTKQNRNIMGNTLEAFIGAFFLDKGYKRTELFIYKRFLDGFVDVDQLQETDISHKSKLLNWANKERKVLTINFIEPTADAQAKRKYHQSIIVYEGQEVAKGMGLSKKEASENGAMRAIKALHELGVVVE